MLQNPSVMGYTLPTNPPPSSFSSPMWFSNQDKGWSTGWCFCILVEQTESHPRRWLLGYKKKTVGRPDFSPKRRMRALFFYLFLFLRWPLSISKKTYFMSNCYMRSQVNRVGYSTKTISWYAFTKFVLWNRRLHVFETFDSGKAPRPSPFERMNL